MGATSIDEGALIDFLLSGSLETNISAFLPLEPVLLPSAEVTCKEELFCILGPKNHLESTQNKGKSSMKRKKQATATKTNAFDDKFLCDLIKIVMEPPPKIGKKSLTSRKNNSKISVSGIDSSKDAKKSKKSNGFFSDYEAVFEKQSVKRNEKRQRKEKHQNNKTDRFDEMPQSNEDYSAKHVENERFGNRTEQTHYIRESFKRTKSQKEKDLNSKKKERKQQAGRAATSVEQCLPQTDKSDRLSMKGLDKQSAENKVISQDDKLLNKKSQKKDKKKQERAARREPFEDPSSFETQRVIGTNNSKSSVEMPRKLKNNGKDNESLMEAQVTDSFSSDPKKTRKNKKKNKTKNTESKYPLASEKAAEQISFYHTEEAFLDEPNEFASDRTLSFESITSPKSKKKKSKKSSKKTSKDAKSSFPNPLEFAPNSKNFSLSEPQLQKSKAKKGGRSNSSFGKDNSMGDNLVLTNDEIEEILIEACVYDNFYQGSLAEQICAEEQSQCGPMTNTTINTRASKSKKKKNKRKNNKSKTQNSTEKDSQ